MTQPGTNPLITYDFQRRQKEEQRNVPRVIQELIPYYPMKTTKSSKGVSIQYKVYFLLMKKSNTSVFEEKKDNYRHTLFK